MTSIVFSIEVLARIGGALQEIKIKELPGPQKSTDTCLDRKMLPNVRTTAKRNVDTEAGLHLGNRAESEVLLPRRQKVSMPEPHRSMLLLKDFIHT